MTSYLDSYTETEFTVQPQYLQAWHAMGVRAVKQPEAFLLGGQSGAGKTTLHEILSKSFDGNVIVINGDEYRKSHPHFNEIQQQYGIDAPGPPKKPSTSKTCNPNSKACESFRHPKTLSK